MDELMFYSGDELRLMEECDCMLNKIVTVVDQDRETEGLWDGFGEMVSGGLGYVELSFCEGLMWRKEVWVFRTREGMDRYIRRYPGHQRFIGRDM